MTLKTKPLVRYSPELKARVLALIEKREIPIAQICKQYGIRSESTVYAWMKEAVKVQESDTLGFNKTSMKAPQAPSPLQRDEEIRELNARLDAVTELWKLELLRSESYLTMIKLRDGKKPDSSKKNSGAKPSKP